MLNGGSKVIFFPRSQNFYSEHHISSETPMINHLDGKTLGSTGMAAA